MLNRRSFLAGLLATATAPVLPPIPGKRAVAYTVFNEIPLEQLGNRVPQVTIEGSNNGRTWNRILYPADVAAQMALMWKVYSPA